MDTKNRNSVPTRSGYHEVVSIKPFGEMIAKLDTGNSVLSVLHAEDIKVSGKNITFTLKDKTITTKIIKTYEALTGGGTDERYVVELELEFLGSKNKFMFGLDDRTKMGTEVLLNRFVMKELNLMIDHQRKFVLTTKLKFEEGE